MDVRPVETLPNRVYVLPMAFRVAFNRVAMPSFAVGVVGGVLIALLLPVQIAWPLRVLAAGSAAGLIGTFLARRLFRGDVKSAYETFSWLGRWELDRFKDATGTEFPRTPPEAAAWLDRGGPMPPGAARVDVLVLAGRVDDAVAWLREPPNDTPTPYEDFERAAQRAWLRWLTSGVQDLSEVRERYMELPIGPDRRRADVTIALAEARAALDHGNPGWAARLAELRPRLGSEPSQVVWRDTWSPLLRAMALVGGAISAVALLVLGRL